MASMDRYIQSKIQRLEELRKYQSYYGPNTPYPVIVEINELETELRHLLTTKQTRPNKPIKKRKAGPRRKKRKRKKAASPFWKVWDQSQATIDAISTIAFIGLVFLFGSVIAGVYMYTQSGQPSEAVASVDGVVGSPAPPTPRPTFTPTLTAEEAANPAISDSNALLPSAQRDSTPIATLVPTLTPTQVAPPTATPQPTEPPPPTQPPAQPRQAAQSAQPVSQPAAQPEESAPPPEPSYPFRVVERGDRNIQYTDYHLVTVYIAIVSPGNIPIGGYKVVGNHVPSGMYHESPASTWDWSVVNCLDCDYIKQGNVKFEPGPFMDGTWNIHLVDGAGNQVSPVVPLSYSEDPDSWVWDFVLFQQ